MRVLIVAVLATGLMLLTATATLAKGASSATITGPGGSGGSRPLDVEGNGEPGSGQTLGMLADKAGFFTNVYGSQAAVARSERPASDLGPRYTIRWTLPGPSGEDGITQDLYPYAEGGPVTYLAPGQRFFGTQRTVGGWHEGGEALTGVLRDAGLPAEPPATGPVAQPVITVLLTLAALVLATGGAAMLTARRGRRCAATVAG